MPEQAPYAPEGPETTVSPDEQPVDLWVQGRMLAEDHSLQAGKTLDPRSMTLLSRRLPVYATILKDAVGRLQAQTPPAAQYSAGAEWLLDNFHIASQALREIEQDLPPHYDRQLLRLRSGQPRIYELAIAIIGAENGLLDMGHVKRFVASYQDVLPLTMGELWALPIMLRLGILECLLAGVIRLTGSDRPFPGETAAILKMIGQVNEHLLIETSIRSLRVLGAADWKHFFESQSVVEATLRQDPAWIYTGMDFETRDRYRKAVEEIAKYGPEDELFVAQEALRLAREGADHGSPLPPVDEQGSPDGGRRQNSRNLQDGWDRFEAPLEVHIGYYLLGKGRPALEEAVGYARARRRLEHIFRDEPGLIYFGLIFGLAFGLMLVSFAGAVMLGDPAPALFLIPILALIPALTISVDLVNWGVTQILKPEELPHMNFSRGLPEECATLVVIPAILSGPDDVDSLMAQLEQHYLRNPDPELSFALLTDYMDASVENRPEDPGIVERARKGIRELNEKYPRTRSNDSGERRFILLHRQRRWNPSEGVWMGWERKRGKLHELNCMILKAQGLTRGSDPDRVPSFPIFEGDPEILQRVRYVITLDADTVLPRDAAQELVATLAHPLNRARLKPAAGGCGEEVVSGYTILQPRTEINPISSNVTYFSMIFSGNAGLDLYTRAVSDVYQDLFGEGSYVGKGIYEVESFERSLEGCIPENSLLSHDLFEGIHGRAALVTSTTLIEDIPPIYSVHARRLHRWIRGDWQLLPWLFSHRLTAISRWKIIDNLRRSLVPPALLVWFAAGWSLQSISPAFFTLTGAVVLAIPFLTVAFGASRGRLAGQPMYQAEAGLANSFLRWLLALVFIPHEAQIAADAIIRTLVRLSITRRNLLRWTTSEQLIRRLAGRDALAIWLQMASSPILAMLIGVLLILFRPAALAWSSPLLVAWFLAPGMATWIGKPRAKPLQTIESGQLRELRRLARCTWLFFEQFMGPEDQWLPPDHFQESPLGVVAHRTSPTNIGLGLLSVLGAYDLGYLEPLSLSTRLASSFDTLEKLDRYRGHLLNWYDTRSLEPLQPRYVSTVDSGNLAASLVTLAQGCLEVVDQPLLRWAVFEGFLDAIDLLDVMFRDMRTPLPGTSLETLRSALDEATRLIWSMQAEPARWVELLYSLSGKGKARISGLRWSDLEVLIVGLVEKNARELGPENLRRLRYFSRGTRQQLNSLVRSVELLLPWHSYFLDIPDSFQDEALTSDQAVAWSELKSVFSVQPTLAEIPATCRAGILALDHLKRSMGIQTSLEWGNALHWIRGFEGALKGAGEKAEDLIASFRDLSRRSDALFQDMNFSFLFDRERQVFHIGYNVTTSELDLNYYDLLASEARLASLIAIARGEVSSSHWLHLARPFIRIGGRQALLSWSATMFEYLMPQLLVRSESGTLLGQTLEVAIDRQIEYGHEKHVPWGISESAYYRFDANQGYQYRAFGVPGLGYKRGLSEDLVVTPYASLLGLSLRPKAVLQNLENLQHLGMMGMYGFYEAVDFTPARLSVDQEMAIIQSYMAHHQGMILLSLVNYLHDEAMVKRFQRDPRMRSVELLLMEQIPRDAPIEGLNAEKVPGVPAAQTRAHASSWEVDPHAPQPRAQYLSNGHYGVLITAAGGGYSEWNGIRLTRWRPDSSLDNWGTWIFVSDLETGLTWSSSLQPTLAEADEQEVYFNGYVVEFHRREALLAQTTQVFVTPKDDVEVRLVTLTNHDDQPRRLRLTSYGEVILAPQETEARHPVFNQLFIASEPLPKSNGLLFHRRPRSVSEEEVWLAHAVVTGQEEITVVRPRLENDRGWFLGRGRNSHHPAALEAGALRGPHASMDPVFAIDQRVNLQPHDTVSLMFLTSAAHSAKDAESLIDRYSKPGVIHAAMEKAREIAEEEMVELEITGSQVKDMQTLLSLLVFPSRGLRATAERLAANRKGQPGLWPYAISGDYPILLAEIGSVQELPLARELLQAHTYWRRRGLRIDLVFLDKQGTNYNQELKSELYNLVASMKSDGWLNLRGGIFLLTADQMNDADRALMDAAARVALDGARGTLAEQLQHSPLLEHKPPRLPLLSPALPEGADPEPTTPVQPLQGLLFDNGLGGFSSDGAEYCIYLPPGQVTPAPWVNVVANKNFGFLVSESGLGASWAGNSGENRLSPWVNDPVTDEPGEALYLRDEETGIVWSPTPRPAPAPTPYLVRHGVGYTIFEHISHGLSQELRLFTPPDDPVKVLQLRLENTWNKPRRITATYYVECVLGVNRESSQQYLIPEYNSDPQALLLRNPYNLEFADHVAFVSASNPLHGLTTDRTEFLGRMGSLELPAALRRIGLAGTVEAGLDTCAALQLHIDIQPGAVEQVYFVLGQGADRESALELARRYQVQTQVEEAWRENHKFWKDLLGAVQVHTPEPAFDILINRWLLYQTLTCRLWGRTAFYQSSGAYGFRDQLQDVLALLHAEPGLAREHLLRAARHQFEAGDVMHWWHPPSSRGVRTRSSDDMLWLPYVTDEYVTLTGDDSVLAEKVPFRRAPLLDRRQDERYGQYPETSASYTLFEHCRRALERGTTSGPHNLPLMGGGDWNDGMSRVGITGRGESVWLGWFLYNVLNRFAGLCEQRGQDEPAAGYRQRASDLAQAIEENAWDGEWYLRAFYDDGSLLGSSENEECRLDSIAQSWGVISGGGDKKRVVQAMQNVYENLVKQDQRLVLLLTPPFDKTPRDPGYIKGYPPGVRENGGQYTHAAIWTAWALLGLDRVEEGVGLFRLLNPILHSDTHEKASHYRVEPYVIAADICGTSPFAGQGGWTWYTGSSSWMYRLGIEEILGLKKKGNTMEVNPRIPHDWPGFRISYRFGQATYEIEVQNPNHHNRGVGRVSLDGSELQDKVIPLSQAAGTHTVLIEMV